MTGDWIAEARKFYQSRPWHAWSLRVGVPPHEPMTRLFEAGDAIARHAGLAAYDVLAAIEIQLNHADLSAPRPRHGMQVIFLMSMVSDSLKRSRRATEQEIDAAITAAYRARGIELDGVRP